MTYLREFLDTRFFICPLRSVSVLFTTSSNVLRVESCYAKQFNLEVDNDDVQELLDSHNQELTIDKLIEMREHDEDIEQPDSLDPVE